MRHARSELDKSRASWPWGVVMGKDPRRDNCRWMLADRKEGVGGSRLEPNMRNCRSISV